MMLINDANRWKHLLTLHLLTHSLKYCFRKEQNYVVKHHF